MMGILKVNKVKVGQNFLVESLSILFINVIKAMYENYLMQYILLIYKMT